VDSRNPCCEPDHAAIDDKAGCMLDAGGMGLHPTECIDLDRLILLRAVPADAERMAASVSASLEHLAPWMSWVTADAGTLERQRERLAAANDAWEAGEEYNFLALSRDSQNVLGRFGLHRGLGPWPLELGYWLCPGAVGHGYATAGAEALTAAALSLTDIQRVEIHCDEANQRSRRVPQRLGYRLDRVEVDGVQAPAEVGRSMIWVFPPDTP
jgi:RimJ/RimL family protein N-acetyltransferase